MTLPSQSSVEYCNNQISHFKTKASHNKTEALWCFRLIMIGTLLAPLFVTLGANMWTEKVIPSVLSAIAAFAQHGYNYESLMSYGLFIGRRKEKLESHLVRYTYKIDDYSNEDDAEKLLVKNVADLSLNAHQKWMPIVPGFDKSSKTKALHED